MKQKLIGTAFLYTLLSWGAFLNASPEQSPHMPHGPKIDFLSSMGWNDKKNALIKQRYFASENPAMKTLFALKEIYDKNNYFERKTPYERRVPKIIHQIWLGPNQPPAIFKKSQESLKKHHPDWEYRLWTDKDVPQLKLYNQKFYDLSDNYGEKADILRYELLYRFGGVYVDVDFICFKPFDILSQYDVWTAIEPIDAARGTGINNAIIGSVPKHPMLKHCIETIQHTWYASPIIFVRVGPLHFKESFLTYAQTDSSNIIAFQKSFFYPLDYREGITHLHGKVNYTTIHSLIKPESFAMHFWAGSWRTKPKKKKIVFQHSGSRKKR